MSRRIEARQAMQLSLPEASTVIVVSPKHPVRVDPEYLQSHYPQEPAIESAVIRAVVQDYNNFGADDIDTNGSLTKSREAIRLARDRGFTFDELIQDIETDLAETRPNLEGRKMGRSPRFLSDVRDLLMGEAEDVYTTPKANQP